MGKDDKTWLKICYGILVAIFAYVFFRALDTAGLYLGWAEEFSEWYPITINFASVVVAALSVYWIQSENERREYHLSAITELRKVNWPSIPDTKKMTTIVVVVVAIFAVILSVFDVFWGKALQAILP